MWRSWHINGLIFVLSGMAWVGAFLLNKHFLPFFSHIPGIDFVFIPSGVRLIAIMVGGIWAVAGVCVGSLFLTGLEFPTEQPWVILAIAAGSGLFPHFALRVSLLITGLKENLGNLTAVNLPLVSLGVAVGSASLHNLVFCLLGFSPWVDFVENAMAMATGDYLGILIAVLVVFMTLRLYRNATA